MIFAKATAMRAVSAPDSCSKHPAAHPPSPCRERTQSGDKTAGSEQEAGPPLTDLGTLPTLNGSCGPQAQGSPLAGALGGAPFLTCTSRFLREEAGVLA